MNGVLRVLQVEDVESDAALVARVLEQAGYQLRSERVDDAAAMRAALARLPWDLIIADYRMPGFDAPAALRVLHESGEDIPFLVVSGTIGEALAVDMMRCGAHDYVMKDNLARLVPAVEREVREAQARRERRRAEDRLAMAIGATGLGTFDYYPGTGEIIWSDIAKRHFGLSAEAEVSYEIFLRGVHPGDRERVDHTVRNALRAEGGGHLSAEYRTVGIEDRVERSVTALGRAFFDAQGRPARLIGVTLEVTERKRLEDQFRQAQKLESIGRLAGGVAHDFNNMLTVIAGYAQMVLDDLAVQHPLREPMNELAKAAARATTLTRQLLAFSRRQASEPKTLVLNDLLRDLEKMVGRLIGADIELTLVLDPEAGCIRADPGQIEQVIMNLVVNANDAMPEGGKLLIETSRQAVDELFADQHLSVAPGTYVSLAVSDTGMGMSAEVKTHIFEPFFTTKEQGKGTGLGLSTVYGIVKQSEGAIWVYSEPGQGTTVRMLFPAAGAEPEPAAAQRREAAPSGTETVLLAEDEPGLRGFVRDVLTRHGYTVLEAANGREALGISHRHTGSIHVLLADIMMPGMGGVELAEQFGREHPKVPVLLMSGYAEHLKGHWEGPATYLQKPFTSAALLTRLRALLQEA